MAKRRPGKLLLLAIGAGHLLVTRKTWMDLSRRAPEQVRGKKVFWRIASAVNTGGSVAYFLFGRKRADSPH
jgi:hypothetical protein